MKNFAQMVELSTGTDENKIIKNILYDLGVNPNTIRSSLERCSNTKENLKNSKMEECPHIDDENPEPLGYANYSDSLDEMGGLLR